jgi:hypothetical protein
MICILASMTNLKIVRRHLNDTKHDFLPRKKISWWPRQEGNLPYFVSPCRNIPPTIVNLRAIERSSTRDGRKRKRIYYFMYSTCSAFDKGRLPLFIDWHCCEASKCNSCCKRMLQTEYTARQCMFLLQLNQFVILQERSTCPRNGHGCSLPWLEGCW